TIATREPGGSPGAERLREVILSGAVKPFGPQAEALMFAAARADLIEKTIRPALVEGCYVVCDRFIDSTHAYQGASGAVEPALITALENVVAGEVLPDLTIVLDLPVEQGLERAGLRRKDGVVDRFEAEGMAFHNKVRSIFLELAKAHPGRFVVIDASGSPDDIEEAVWKVVEARLLKPGGGNVSSPRHNLKVIHGSAGRTKSKSAAKDDQGKGKA
ncbi:MAG: dTMP kinase, partial [Alphaproteobacteria bacterium]|nr:dTMP kinase [Alphaproteobacteria bacterium]